MESAPYLKPTSLSIGWGVRGWGVREAAISEAHSVPSLCPPHSVALGQLGGLTHALILPQNY